MKMRSKYLLLFGLAVLTGMAVTVGAGLLVKPYTYQGSVINPPVKAADFTLTDQNGQPFTLSSLQGKTAVIFFGFTHCQDVCPITLGKFKQIKADLGAQGDKVQFIFITVDPERDTVAAVKEYISKYDPSFTGLTGTPTQRAEVWKNYGVYVEKKPVASPDDYEMDHSTQVYVIDAGGNWMETFPYWLDTRGMVEDLKHVLRKQ